MNTKDNINIEEMTKILSSITTDTIKIKTIFLVKYHEVHHMPELKITRKNTYNLFTFEDLDMAIKYMDLAHEVIVVPNLEKFKILFKTTPEYMLPDNDEKIVLKRCTKLVGNTDMVKCQTKFFTFIIEKINFKHTVN